MVSKLTFLNTTEAAKMTGFSESYIRFLLRQGKLPGLQIVEGGRWLIPMQALMDALQAGAAVKDGDD